MLEAKCFNIRVFTLSSRNSVGVCFFFWKRIFFIFLNIGAYYVKWPASGHVAVTGHRQTEIQPPSTFVILLKHLKRVACYNVRGALC